MTDPLAHKAARAELWTRVFVVLTATTLVIFLSGGTLLLVKVSHVTDAIRSTQKTNTSVNTTNTQLLQIIHSCLTPGQPCYRLGQEQRAQTAKGNRRVVVAAVTCAATIPDPTVPSVGACVQTSLAHDRGR